MKTFILLFCTIISINAYGISQEYIKNSIKKAADKVGVPVELLSAICWAESRQEPIAYVHGDGSNNNHAYGMCQILYTTALDMGMKKDLGCEGDFRTLKALGNAGIVTIPEYEVPERNYKTCKLFGPYTNAYYAAKYLRWKLDTYNESWISAIAAYNSGTVRTCPKKGYFTSRTYSKGVVKHVKIKCEPGGLLNQRYVDRVLKALKEGK